MEALYYPCKYKSLERITYSQYAGKKLNIFAPHWDKGVKRNVLHKLFLFSLHFIVLEISLILIFHGYKRSDLNIPGVFFLLLLL
jgi:phosphorylcholine metabolism protein LicD